MYTEYESGERLKMGKPLWRFREECVSGKGRQIEIRKEKLPWPCWKSVAWQVVFTQNCAVPPWGSSALVVGQVQAMFVFATGPVPAC
jgi:hypothetical protein